MKSLTYCLFICLILALSASGRNQFDPEIKPLKVMTDSTPYLLIAVHNIGKIALTVSNYGIIGKGTDQPLADPLTGEPAPSVSYPKGYGLTYLYEGGFWVGAIVGRDTLVSTSTGADWGVYEFWPHTYPTADIIYRSINDPEAPEFDSAVSQQDFITNYADTLTDHSRIAYDYYSRRFHRPMNVKITQRSYAWGNDYAEDFVIFDCTLGNIGLYDLKDVYVGIYVDNDCGRESRGYIGGDDICGFRKTVRSKYIAFLTDTINVAWAADNDGDPDPVSGDFQGLFSPTGVVGVRVLRTPAASMDLNFNWWVRDYDAQQDWGPRRVGTPSDPFRSFDGYLGTPVGDNNKYYMMSHKEFDYDQERTIYDHSTEGWLPPPANASVINRGADIRYLLSFGPFNLNPGDQVPFTFAIIGGQNFHRGHNFDDLGLNAVWAEWIYDNPGIDTDGDGFKGIFHLYCHDSTISRIDTIPSGDDTLYDTLYSCGYGDTIYYKGDGIPDFRGAASPPSPKVKLYPRVNKYNEGEIVVRWNGRLSEITPDQFSQQVDFEGYRVYTSLSGRAYDFTLMSSFDIENYDRWEYDNEAKIWFIRNQPYAIGRLHQLYGDNFDPEKYFDSDHQYPVYNWQTRKYDFYYFTRHDWNQSDLLDTTKIHKVYPNQPYPSTLNLDSAVMFYPSELTEDGEMKYFEYEYTLTRLLPSQQYYVSVTAFDQGFPARKLHPLETSPDLNAQREFAQNSSELVIAKGLNVVVYPNPYRIDGGYRERFEGWEHPDLPVERNRAIHFTNLPNKCTIRIFSLDGDLIREINHDYAPGAAGSMHDSWDLISRNTMTVTSGIYYYSVSSEYGNQIGKFVIIK